MAEPTRGGPPPPKTPEDRLDSWKEIAAYLNRDVTTVQRWERREGMPVHRHLHDRAGSVYAYRAELDAWVRSRHPQAAQNNGEDAAASAEASKLPAQKIISRTKLAGAWVASGILVVLALAAVWGAQHRDYFWRNPLKGARFQALTDFDGVAEAAAISRDGHFVAFLSDRDGPMDVWVSQAGSGQFHNLTKGSEPELLNPSVRTLGFSPDGSLVTFWVRKRGGLKEPHIGVWAVPTLGGAARPYLEEAAELDWSSDGSLIAYHTTGPGDPLFVSDGASSSAGRLIFQGPAGSHCHFPLWAPDSKFIYFVHGALPDQLNVWRIGAAGGRPERITPRPGRIGYPTFLDERTLVYLATDADNAGPWLYSMDVEHRIPHRLTAEPERYTSVSASADGRHLVLTLAHPKRSLWRMRLGNSFEHATGVSRISLSTDAGLSPRIGPDYLVYVSATGTGDSVWKLANGAETQLWSGQGARMIGGPAVSPDGAYVAFSVQQQGRDLLYVMRADGTNARILTDSLALQGAPAWAPDGQSITTAANENGVPHLFRVPLGNGGPTSLVAEYSLSPAWEPDGGMVLYSGPDIGTQFSLKATNADGTPHSLPAVALSRGTRHLAFFRRDPAIVVLRGEIQHKNLWLIDLKSGAERQLTNFAPDFDILDFDISRDGHDVVLERVQDRSDLILVDLPRE